jgi:hypothetical protein
MVTRPLIGTSYSPLRSARRNRVTVLALLLLACLSFAQAKHGSFHGLSNDELAQVEKAGTAGLPDVATPFTIDMPIDHFNKSDHRTYKNRYWVNATYYKEGGPVFL